MAAERKPTAANSPRPTESANPFELARSWLLLALVALVVARPLLPSEGVSWLGDGQPFNMLTMLVAAGYLLLATLQGGIARRINIVDLAVAALVAVCAVSAFVAASEASPRPSINMLFEWIAMGLLYFLARQLLQTPRETRALVAVMIALAVVVSGYGFFQVFVSLPADRAAYAADPDALLLAAGQWYPPGSPGRVQFENRLQSSEPTATFALTNSLAGFLAPWLIVALGIGLSQMDRRRAAGPSTSLARTLLTGWLGRSILLTLCLLAVAGCLVLTKSRSAYVAMAVGVATLPLLDSRVRRRVATVRFALAAGAVLLVIIGGALAVRGLDREVLTEANKSLGYRLEYWRATLAMIARHPWLGVGPGNFQDYYTQFKLPQASEEIRDPHNFLLEVWVTAGTFALVALVECLGAFALRTWRMKTPDFESLTDNASTSADMLRNPVFMAAGAALGFLLAFVIAPTVGLSFSETQLAGGLLLGAGVLALLWPWVLHGALPPRLPAVAVLVLLIHWLGAGSIAFPGVAGTFWILLAIGLNSADGPASLRAASPGAPSLGASRWRRIAWAPAAGLVATCAAIVACYFVAYGPVVHAQAVMARLDAVRSGADARVNLLLDAAEADPLSAEPWLAIAEIENERLLHDPNDRASMQRFVTATAKVIELRPRSSSIWRRVGRWYCEFHEVNHHAMTAKAAAESYARAVELYPNLASLRGEYALALHENGQSTLARRQIEAARRLDGQTPHADKKLSDDLRRQLDELDTALR